MSISCTQATFRHLLETRLTKAQLEDIFGLAGGPQHLLHAQQHSQRQPPRAANSLTCRESLPSLQFTADVQATAASQKAVTSVAAPVQRLSGLHDPIAWNSSRGQANGKPISVRLQLALASAQALNRQQEVNVSQAAAAQQSEVPDAEHQPSPTVPLPNDRSASCLCSFVLFVPGPDKLALPNAACASASHTPPVGRFLLLLLLLH